MRVAVEAASRASARSTSMTSDIDHSTAQASAADHQALVISNGSKVSETRTRGKMGRSLVSTVKAFELTKSLV